MRLERSFQEYCQDKQLFTSSDTIIVGVSGGKDSVTLLHLLAGLSRSAGLKLIVAHFNHRLRPSASTDEAFVKTLARSYRLPLVAGRSRRRRHKKTSEQEARLERFAFFNQQALKYSADAVALAHSRDDLAETLLMRLIRGGGMKGLAAITPKRRINDALYIRPLLFASRKDILHYAKTHKLIYREDPTNKQKKFFRNLIRLELLPLLEKKYNPNIKEILAQTADNAATDYDYLLQCAQSAFVKICATASASRVTLKLHMLKSLHPALQRLVLRLCIEKLAGSTRRITFKHWQELNELIFKRPRDSRVDLPKNIRAQKDVNSIKLYISKA